MAEKAIRPFTGEFLVSPIPLEMNGWWCSHACPYCFANLNRPDRAIDYRKTINQLLRNDKQNDLTAQLLRRKHPVLISNHVDPFSVSNNKNGQMTRLIELLVNHDVPVALQTKGGIGIDDVLSFLDRPIVWYVTIEFSDDASRKRVAPAAPPIEERWELIDKVIALGHRVVLGFNPCVPEWCLKPFEVLDNAERVGVSGVWFQSLHLNPKQVKNMPEKWKQDISGEVIAKARKKHGDTEFTNFVSQAIAYARSIGLETFEMGQYEESGFFDPFYEVYGDKAFPTIQGFVNYCHSICDGEQLYFGLQEWMDYFTAYLPEDIKTWQHRDYVMSRFWRKSNGFQVSQVMSYEDTLLVPWKLAIDKPDMRFLFPLQSSAFSYWVEEALDGEYEQVFDRGGTPMILFNPNGTENLYDIYTGI